MADDPELAGRPRLKLDLGAVLAASAVLCVGIAGAGTGFLNGDAAVYAAQGWQGDLLGRPVHAGYTTLAGVLAPLAGAALPRWLDAVSAIACAATALGAGAIAGGLKHRAPWIAAALTGAVLLPVASFAEADPVWAALVVWAAAVPRRGIAGVLVALAVSVSPLAILALPWITSLRRRRVLEDRPWGEGRAWLRENNPNGGLWAAALVVVILLTAVSAGAWWTGPRGVLEAPWPRPWRAILAWASSGVPWFAAPLWVVGWVAGGGPGLLSTVFLLLAPPDTGAWAPLAVSLALVASRGAHTVRSLRWVGLALLVLAAVEPARGLWRWSARCAEVREAEALTAQVLAAMGPEDGLVAPWTWGVRASVRATGDPYALSWRVPGPPVRDPTPWCNQAMPFVWLLPPEAVPVAWVGATEQEGRLVRISGASAAVRPLPGCGVGPVEAP